VLIGALMTEQPWFRRTVIGCLVYMWSAAAALGINYAAGWQYDGDLGWWFVTAYSMPALALVAPIASLASNPDVGAIYALLALAGLTLVAVAVLRRSAQAGSGN
jgi:hypothetical protein